MTNYLGISPNNPRDYVGPDVALVPCVTRPRRPTVNDITNTNGKKYKITTIWQVGEAPSTGTEGEMWILTAYENGQAIWQMLSTGSSGALEQLSDDVGTAVTPTGTPPTIQLVGHVVEQGATKFSTVTAGSHLLNINPMSSARWIVDPLGFNGTHTTLASALASASSGDSIDIVGGSTLTENVTLKNGVSIYSSDFIGGVGTKTRIIGKLIDNGIVVNAVITNIEVKTNSDNFLALTASGSSITFEGCNLNCSNATGMNVGLGTNVNAYNCTGDLGTTGIGFWTGAGNVFPYGCNFSNSGNSTTASSLSGSSTIKYCQIGSPIVSSGAGLINLFYSNIDCSSLNATALTTAGTGSSQCIGSNLNSGSASGVSIGAGTTVKMIGNCTVNSSNTNAIAGTGTLSYTPIGFHGSSNLIQSTLTQTRLPLGNQMYVLGGQDKFPVGEFSLLSDAYSSANTSLLLSAMGVTPASITAGFGNVLTLNAQNSSGNARAIGSIGALYRTVTDTAENSFLQFATLSAGSVSINQKIDARGNTSTTQPCFTAYASSNASNVTGDGTTYRVVFGSNLVNQGNGWNGTDTFTAPQTGNYLLSYAILTQGNAAANSNICSIATTSTTYSGGEFGALISGNYSYTLTVIAPMTAGDIARVNLTTSGGGKTVSVYGAANDPRTIFSGYLLC